MDRISGRKYGIDKRIPTEQRSSKFYSGDQHRYFDRLIDIPSTSQIVYKVDITRPVEVFDRDLKLWVGGREYLVYPDSANITFTGALTPAGVIAPLNGMASRVSDLTAQRAIGQDIFTPSITDIPIIGTAVLTEGNTSKASSIYSLDSVRLGLPVSTLWIVLNHIGPNAVTNGHLSISWEEV